MDFITIKNMKVHNFRRVKDFVIEPNGQSIDISAETGAGKTSVKDAYLFCLGIPTANFEPFDKENKRINATTEVELTLVKNTELLDPIEVVLKRVSKQKYNSDNEYVGTVSKYYVDDMELSATKYKDFISSFFGIDFTAIRIVSDLDFFNSNATSWGWKNRREFILNTISAEAEAKSIVDKYPAIANYLSFHTPEEILKAVTTKIGEINKNITAKNTIIEHNNKTVEELAEIDFDMYAKEKARLFTENAENTAIQTIKGKLSAVNNEITTETEFLKKKAYEHYNSIDSSILSAENECALTRKSIENSMSMLKTEKMQLAIAENKLKTFSSTQEKICPVCGKPYSEEELKKAYDIFAEELQKQINEHNEKIARTNELIEKKNKSLKELGETHSLLISRRKPLKDIVERFCNESEVLSKLIAEQKSLVAKLQEQESNGYGDWVDKIEEIDKILAKKYLYDKAVEENNELNTQLKALTLAYEKQMERKMQITAYSNELIELISTKVNSKFKNVRFKFIKEYGANSFKGSDFDCVVLHKGIPYDYCSNGEKILCDFDIVNGLQEHFGVYAPIWIDEAQSCTKPLETVTQKISLFTVANKSL